MCSVIRMNSYALGLSEHHLQKCMHRQPWLDIVGRLTMSACAGQRTSGEASGWVWWSSSRTDWNHGHGCSHGVGASQPKQQGSTVQLLDIISSPVPLRACGARLGAPAEHQDAGWPRPAAGWGHAHMYGLCPHAVLSRDSQTPSRGACPRGGTFMLKL